MITVNHYSDRVPGLSSLKCCTYVPVYQLDAPGHVTICMDQKKVKVPAPPKVTLNHNDHRHQHRHQQPCHQRELAATTQQPAASTRGDDYLLKHHSHSSQKQDVKPLLVVTSSSAPSSPTFVHKPLHATVRRCQVGCNGGHTHKVI